MLVHIAFLHSELGMHSSAAAAVLSYMGKLIAYVHVGLSMLCFVFSMSKLSTPIAIECETVRLYVSLLAM